MARLKVETPARCPLNYDGLDLDLVLFLALFVKFQVVWPHGGCCCSQLARWSRPHLPYQEL